MRNTRLLLLILQRATLWSVYSSQVILHQFIVPLHKFHLKDKDIRKVEGTKSIRQKSNKLRKENEIKI
jgi:hypothetical protein